jgi:hypothetical protein
MVHHRHRRLKEDAEAGFQKPKGEVELLRGIKKRLIKWSDAVKYAAMNHTRASSEIGRCRRSLGQALVPERNEATVDSTRRSVDDQKANDAQIDVSIEVFERHRRCIGISQLSIVVEEEKNLAPRQGNPGIAPPADAVVAVQDGYAHLRVECSKKLLRLGVRSVHHNHDLAVVDALPANRFERAQ